MHWVGRGTGTPKDKDEVRRRILHLIIMVLDSHTTTQSQPPRSSSYSLNPKPIQENRLPHSFDVVLTDKSTVGLCVCVCVCHGFYYD